jgi:hypothetical protein
MSTKPTVVLNEEVYRKIMYWVNRSEFEVSGLGTVTYDKEKNQFNVLSAMLLPQKNGATHTDIEADVVCKAMFELANEPGELKFWWHSHVNMAVFWSGTDMDTIKSFGGGGWVLATVFNKKNECRSAYYGVDGLFPVFIDELGTNVTQLVDPRIPAWEEEYKKNVVISVPKLPMVPSTISGNSWAAMRGPGGTLPGIDRTYSEAELEEAYLSGQRPLGMSKRRWKEVKKRYRDEEAALAAIGQTAADLVDDYSPNEDDMPEDFGTDWVHPYPFSQEELSALAQLGVDQTELDGLLTQHYRRSDILAWMGLLESELLDAVEFRSFQGNYA